MDLGIAGKWALVCGASKGLGYGCALSLAQEGVNLVINARSAGPVKEAAERGWLGPGVRVSLGFLTGLALDLRIRLSLRADQVPPLRLGARNADRPQLGWNTWLRGRNDPRPANDSEFHFSAMGGQSWH